MRGMTLAAVGLMLTACGRAVGPIAASLGLLASCLQCPAATITISGPHAPITVGRGDTLELLPGASITPTPDVDSTAVTAVAGALVVASGGTFSGALGPGDFNATVGIFAIGAVVTVSGGSFLGGAGPNGGAGLVTFASDVTISGGVFSGGAGSSGLGTNGGGDGAGLRKGGFLPAETFAVSGGSFSGGDSSAGIGGAAVVLDGVGTVSGGDFRAGSGPGGTRGSLLFMGQAGDTVTVSGGSFAGPIELDFGDGLETVTFVGRSPFSYSDGILGGVLADGTAIGVALSITAPPGIVTSIQRVGQELIFGTVPEPPGAMLLSLGLAAVAGVGWHRRAG